MENRPTHIHILVGIGESINNFVIGVVAGLILSGLTAFISYLGNFNVLTAPIFLSLSVFNIITFIPSLIYIIITLVGFKGLTAGSIAYLVGWIATMSMFLYFKIITGLDAALDFEVPLIIIAFKFSWLLMKPAKN